MQYGAVGCQVERRVRVVAAYVQRRRPGRTPVLVVVCPLNAPAQCVTAYSTGQYRAVQTSLLNYLVH